MNNITSRKLSANQFPKIDNLFDFVNYINNQYSTKIAIIDKDISYNYDQLYQDIMKVKKYIETNNEEYTNIAVYLPNSYEFIVTVFGIITAGCIPVLLPYGINEQMKAKCLTQFNCGLLIDYNYYQLVINTNIEQIKTTMSQCLHTADDLCIIMLTAGTTGPMKGVKLSHKNIIAGLMNSLAGFQPKGHQVYYQTYLSVLPFTHIFGFVSSLMRSLFTGSTNIICDLPKNMFYYAKKYNPTCSVMVPGMLEIGLKLLPALGNDILGQNMHYVIVGAAYIPPYLISEYAKLNIIIYPGYGMTETSCFSTGNLYPELYPNSIGVLYDNLDYCINKDGELLVKGDTVFLGYYNNDSENEKAFVNGYFKTGDLVNIDKNGCFYIKGRKKDIIITSSGENISPAYIESLFKEDQHIEDCIVYNKNNDLYCQVLPRFAISNQNIALEVVQNINKTLPSYMQITKFIIKDQDDFIKDKKLTISRKDIQC